MASGSGLMASGQIPGVRSLKPALPPNRFGTSRRRAVAGLFLAAVCAAGASAQSPLRNSVRYLSFDEARPVLSSLTPILPAELKTPETQAVVWPDWVKRSDAQTRVRLARGDHDSLVNMLLFGTTFTAQPRMTAGQIDQIIGADPAAAGPRLDAITEGRLNDFLAAAANPRGNERLAFARQVLAADGFSLDTTAGRARAKTHLLGELSRVLKEIDANARIVDEARRSGVAGAEFAERSRLYRGRGLSSDTSLLPNFAIEEALKAMSAKGMVGPRVARVAVVGPGLDFADKQEGYDFYPQQTLQPFAILDSLLRLGLADMAGLQLTTMDVSPRINAHLASLSARSRRGDPYVLQLPLAPDEVWGAGFLEYWRSFGDHIGTPAVPTTVPPAVGDVKLRAVAVRPDVGAKVTAMDLNIVLQRVDLAPEERFDLVVGTNVFLYYDEFQQALATANVDAMLKPGGVLLSNNALAVAPSSRLRVAGDTTVAYSAKNNGDTVLWYLAGKN
jgi:hypothetical protein